MMICVFGAQGARLQARRAPVPKKNARGWPMLSLVVSAIIKGVVF
jgi:hypothetical protein